MKTIKKLILRYKLMRAKSRLKTCSSMYYIGKAISETAFFNVYHQYEANVKKITKQLSEI